MHPSEHSHESRTPMSAEVQRSIEVGAPTNHREEFIDQLLSWLMVLGVFAIGVGVAWVCMGLMR